MSGNETGYPSRWKDFCAHVPNTGAEFFGFVRTLAEVNRFSARYRAANSFRGLNLEGYTPNTVAGYSALVRVIFVYSAFETFLKITGHSRESIGQELEKHGAVQLMTKLKIADADNRFYAFIYGLVDARHQKELQNYFNDNPCNVAYLAAAIRHIFAHGWLTPGAGGGEASAAAEICNQVCDFLLSFMDTQFAMRVEDGLKELYGG